MTVIITAGRLAELTAAGTQNNPLIGIDSIYAKPGAFTTGGATAPRGADGKTYTYWNRPEGGFPNYTYELTTPAACNMAAIAAHNLHTEGYSIRPQYFDGAAWQNAAGAAHTPTTGEPIIWLFAAQTRAQWRFTVVDLGSGTANAVVGVFFVGRSYHFDQAIYAGYNEAIYPTEVELLANSAGSHVLGTSIIGRGSNVQWDMEHLSQASVYTTDAALMVDQYNRGRGFFAAWRPASRQTAYYAWRSGAPVQVPNAGPNTRKSLSLQMRVYVD